MEDAAKLRLKQFLDDNFCFDGLKAAGFWPKGTRRTDYEKIAARVCQFFGLKSVYEYADLSPFAPSKKQSKWEPLKVDAAELVSQDHWLN